MSTVDPLEIAVTIDALVSHAQTSGLFDSVHSHELKSAPGGGMACQVFLGSIAPDPRRSGLSSSSMVVTYIVRVVRNMLAEPQDDGEKVIGNAAGVLFASLHNDFRLDSAVFAIDLLGKAGTPMSARTGHYESDGKLFRGFDITVPVIVADVLTQAP